MTAEKIIAYLKTRYGFQSWWNSIPEDTRKTILADLDGFTIRKTWREWDEERIDGIVILDPDGFRSFPDDKLYSQKEFLETRRAATVKFLRKSNTEDSDPLTAEDRAAIAKLFRKQSKRIK